MKMGLKRLDDTSKRGGKSVKHFNLWDGVYQMIMCHVPALSNFFSLDFKLLWKTLNLHFFWLGMTFVGDRIIFCDAADIFALMSPQKQRETPHRQTHLGHTRSELLILLSSVYPSWVVCTISLLDTNISAP